jgi:hypothetical protein
MNRDIHKHKQNAERYTVRQKQTVAGAKHHINKSTHHIPQVTKLHTTYRNCDISLEVIEVQYKNHAWHIVLSPQTFGRGDRWEKITLP